MKLILFSLLPLSLLLGSLSAQEEDVPPKFFRFIPLGELPMWDEELVEGIRKGKEPPEGSMPPKPASIISGAEPVPLRLSLRAMSDMVKVAGATPRLTIKEGEVGAAQNWLTEKMPTAPLSLGVLFRNPQTMTWKQPELLLLKDDPSSFPAGKIRLVNVSQRNILVQIGNPNANPAPPIFGVRAGKETQKDLEVGVNQIRVGYIDRNGRQQWIWSNQVRLLRNQRLQTFFYQAQGENPRQEVLFHFVPEPLPRLPQRQ